MSTSISLRHLLTQQQRNNKRQRANPQQLMFLQKMFKKNPRPDHAAREQISRAIDMTPRSVQIWFQNNRAKLKKVNSGTFRSNLRTVLKPRMSSSDTKITTLQLCDDDFYPYSPQSMEDYTDDRVSFVNCNTLNIGEWVRVRGPDSDTHDLLVYTSSKDQCLYYTTLHAGSHYRLVVPVSAINGVSLVPDLMYMENATIQVDIAHPEQLEFEFKQFESAPWTKCSDFTGGEIWKSHTHQLVGEYSELVVQAAQLVELKF